jgi:hypothetical protein
MTGRWRSLWGVAKGLLLASLVPLVVALGCFFVPVENPGVQRCGSPLLFAVGGERNQRVERAGIDDQTYDARRAQAPCSERAEARVRVGFVAGAVFVVLAGSGAVLGLIDDRRRLREAPRFEDLPGDRRGDRSVSRP